MQQQSEPSATMDAPQRKPVDILVIAEKGPGATEPTFRYEAKLPGKKEEMQNKHETLWFARGHTNQYIAFRLQDDSKEHLEFDLSDGMDSAIWIASGGCPKGVGIDEAFGVPDYGKKELTLHDKGTAGEYHYRLNFVGDKGTRSYDPIIRNDGPPPFIDL